MEFAKKTRRMTLTSFLRRNPNMRVTKHREKPIKMYNYPLVFIDFMSNNAGEHFLAYVLAMETMRAYNNELF